MQIINSSETSKPHKPVLIKEVLEALSPQDEGIYIDATFGAGGYTKEILTNAGCKVHGIDRDSSVAKFADDLSKQFEGRFKFINGEFGSLENIILDNNLDRIDGIVFDIGVSSMQLDQGERGFSFAKNAPLDMRMDQNSGGITAYDIVNSTSEQDLADIIFKFGGERKSRKIAYLINKARSIKPIETTCELAEIIARGNGRYGHSIHPATKAFQALRIVVNDELTQLENALIAAAKYIALGGKILVITFHSLEDKIVKEYFNELCGKRINTNRHLPQIEFYNEPNFEFVFKGALTPSNEEVSGNPRARSAKLRAIRRIK
ncbi:Ribosomal RNA small subunit methyltransferase H [Candidatus Jidaibacter acanthamoeba]|uniref:Ribosomal RNA small subunit methyltransferase H n=1 Tax=Candidatus Jidaibacter acanthamoebae TaxID=86105 RepID=A0A0C1MQB4_9RICK|nr:16S rRNA (cytosine(1402)-N(4))-methyltransferase RsmH [Candidatus Jidaibacter acanthamoeba]KIE04157.1 Ribosomal RNA small subunit methyltransferase H [Candidatus Jidaibacter acanthamoeba]